GTRVTSAPSPGTDRSICSSTSPSWPCSTSSGRSASIRICAAWRPPSASSSGSSPRSAKAASEPTSPGGEAVLDSQQIDALKKITSPSVANAIETFKVRPREAGNVSSQIRALFPELGPMVGHAVTALIRAEQGPIDGHRASTYAWWDYVQT